MPEAPSKACCGPPEEYYRDHGIGFRLVCDGLGQDVCSGCGRKRTEETFPGGLPEDSNGTLGESRSALRGRVRHLEL